MSKKANGNSLKEHAKGLKITASVVAVLAGLFSGYACYIGISAFGGVALPFVHERNILYIVFLLSVAEVVIGGLLMFVARRKLLAIVLCSTTVMQLVFEIFSLFLRGTHGSGFGMSSFDSTDIIVMSAILVMVPLSIVYFLSVRDEAALSK